MTWGQYKAQVDAFGKALIAQAGCDKFDSVNILGFNAPAWLVANFGAIAAGCVPAGIYSTNGPEACRYITHHSKAKVVVVEGVRQLEKYYAIGKELPHLRALVMYGGEALPNDIQSKCSVPCFTFDEYIELGMKKDTTMDATLKERSDSWKPGETCTLIYTSGTTGPPKVITALSWNPRPFVRIDPVGVWVCVSDSFSLSH
jgi:long-chain-fatty-acid--CoA ligase ACSBG